MSFLGGSREVPERSLEGGRQEERVEWVLG